MNQETNRCDVFFIIHGNLVSMCCDGVIYIFLLHIVIVDVAVVDVVVVVVVVVFEGIKK